jgi:hypothetical protein
MGDGARSSCRAELRVAASLRVRRLVRFAAAVACVAGGVRPAPGEGVALVEGGIVVDSDLSVAAVVADVTGDGLADLVAPPRSYPMRVRAGNGDGTFQAPRDYFAGNSAAPAARAFAGRLNGDAAYDVVTTHTGSYAFKVYLSDGQGGLVGKLYTFTHSSAVRESIALIDWDDDGDLDVLGVPVITGGGSFALTFGRIDLWPNAGDGTFGAAQALVANTGGTTEIAVGDFDGDGQTDVATLVTADARVRVFWRDADALSASSDVLLGTSSAPARALLTGDFDGDGSADLAVTAPGDGATDDLVVLLRGSDRRFAPPARYASRRVALSTAPFAVADLNGDGSPDILTPHEVFVNRGDGRLGPPLPFGGPTGNGVATGDVDGDGRAEVLVLDLDVERRLRILPVVAPASVPTISLVNPGTLHAGATRTVRLEGGWFAAGSVSDLGDGVTVLATRVVSPELVEADVVVAADVGTGVRTVELIRPDGEVATADVTLAEGGVATVSAISPGRAHAEDALTLTVEGADLVDGATAALGDGVTVNAATVVDGKLVVDVTLAADAAAGPRDVSVTNGTGVVTTMSSAFQVLPRRSIRLFAQTGRLRTSRRPARDDFSVSGSFAFNGFSPDGTFDPVTESVELRFGDPAAPTVVSIAPDVGWRVRYPRARWRSPRGARPAVSLTLDLDRGTFRFDVRRTDATASPTGQVLAEITLGTETGTSVRTWRPARRGALVLR